ncbi:hypothetical protein TIFTF001_012292 [Ficus carica]|uniref:DUF4283 domain-containing protein n=1 Tax=Ficus carica TaxID=3494 RepID=A0AA88AFN7_FICCA|nr:hypothetical protein TIFTF001_012292 [Ficus carica]
MEEFEEHEEDLTRRTARLEWGEGYLDLVPDSSILVSSNSRKLVAKVLCQRKLGRLAVRKGLVKAWSDIAVWYLQEEGPNILVFTFKTKEDRDLILERCPWRVCGSHMIIQELTPGVAYEHSRTLLLNGNG